MKEYEVVITANFEKKFIVNARNKKEAENIVGDIWKTTNLLDVDENHFDCSISITDKEDADDDSECEDCPYYDGEECLYDELY